MSIEKPQLSPESKEFVKSIAEYDPEKLEDSNSKDNETSILEEVDKKKTIEKKDSMILMRESVEFTYKERDIDFPDHLIEKTGGVKGYIRKTIEWKSIEEMIGKMVNKDELKEVFDLIKKYPNKIDRLIRDYPNIIDKEDLYKEIWTINSMQDLYLLKDVCDDICHLNEKGEISKKIDFRKVMKVGGISNAVENFTTNIINKLGDNFISKTNIHEMNSHGRFPNDKENFQKKMLLQRVFDPELCLSGLLESENYDDFYDRIFTGFSCKHFNIFSAKDLKIVDGEKSYEIFKKFGNNSERLLKYLKDNLMFLEPIVGNYSLNGLSVSNEGFWGCDRNSYDYRGTRSFFGFSNDNKAYLKYLNSCSNLYKKLLKANISNDDFKDRDNDISCDDKYKGIKSQMGYPWLDDNTNLDDFIETGKCYEIKNSDQRHPIIPVIINHPDIPDLRWCHSSYAFIPSKNGMNIIKMKS